MKNISSLILIILGLGVAYFGYTELQESSVGIAIGDLEIKAEDGQQSSLSYIIMVVGALLAIFGITRLKKG